MRRAVIRWTVLVLVAIGGAAAIYFFTGDDDDGPARSPAQIRTPVRVVEPTLGTLERTFSVSGYVESDQVVTVTPKVQGSLEELRVELGDKVEAGEVIAAIEDDQYRLNLRQAEANFAGAESTFLRTEELYRSDATSRQNYDQARAQFQAAEAQLELARLQMSHTSVTAPITGTVIQRHTAAGSVVGTTSPIVTIGDLTDLVVRAKIPEQHVPAFTDAPGVGSDGAPEVAPGAGAERAPRGAPQPAATEMEVRVTLPAINGDPVPARIRTVSPYVSPSSRNFDVVVDLTGRTATLRPGMFVEVTFVLERREEVHALPFEAFSDDGELWYLREDGTVAAETLDPAFSTEEMFAVPAEWAERRVVIEGQNFLTEGQEVTVLEENSAS